MKKHVKIVLNIVIICCILLNVCMPVIYAESDETMNSIMGGAKNFITTGTNAESPINDNALENGSNLLYNVLLTIGIAVALIWGLVLGIQFVTGSLEEKADVKKGLIIYLIGCVVIFGAFGIWRLLLQLLQPLA